MNLNLFRGFTLEIIYRRTAPCFLAEPGSEGEMWKMATIQDVAKHAGVSIATVSRVLNGSAYVNKEVADRVRAAVKELQYQPSRAAQALRANRSRIIGLLISDIENPFF